MMVLDQLNSRGLAPSAIEVEVTEGVLLNEDFELVRSTMFDLKARGVRIALDDFGTGFASLIHLRRFPVDSIKIDRGFVSGLLHQAEEPAFSNWLHEPCLGASHHNVSSRLGLNIKLQLNGPKARA